MSKKDQKKLFHNTEMHFFIQSKAQKIIEIFFKRLNCQFLPEQLPNPAIIDLNLFSFYCKL